MRPEKPKTRLSLLILLNGTIIMANILLFSRMFLGLPLTGGSAFSLALGWTGIIVSAIAFFGGNYRLLKQEELPPLNNVIPEISTLNQCYKVLDARVWVKTFAGKIAEIKNQIKRFQKKKATINNILLDKFGIEGLSYRSFTSVLDEVEPVVCSNIKSILNKISAFDEEEYRDLVFNGQHSDPLTNEKVRIFNEYISFVDQAARNNEGIILKLDQMLLEVSRYNTLDGEAVEQLPAIREMDALIKNAELYK
jgi:hypothetical protein